MIIKHSILDNRIVDYEKNKDLFWIELIQPSESEIKTIIQEFKIPDDYISDINDPYEIPRTEGLIDDNPDLFVLNYPIKEKDDKFITRPISIIILENKIITVRNEYSKIFGNIFNKTNFDDKHIKNTEKLLMELAWTISKNYIEDVKNLNQKIAELEQKLRKSTKTELLYEMIDIQKSLINFETSTRENAPVIESIFKLEENPNNNFKNQLLKDLQKENKQARIMIEKSSNYLEKLSDLYSNVLSNNMNVIMKVLTSASIVMTVPTIIGGLWGMNTSLPLENHPNAFWILLLISTITSIGIIMILKRKDYL